MLCNYLLKMYQNSFQVQEFSPKFVCGAIKPKFNWFVWLLLIDELPRFWFPRKPAESPIKSETIIAATAVIFKPRLFYSEFVDKIPIFIATNQRACNFYITFKASNTIFRFQFMIFQFLCSLLNDFNWFHFKLQSESVGNKNF